MSGITLRPAEAADEGLLLAIYASTRSEEMAIVPWDEAQKEAFLQMQFTAQRNHYVAHYPSAVQQIVLVEAQPAGHLWYEEQKDRIHVLDLTVLPTHRNQEIESALLRRLMAQAGSGKAVTIYVESFHPSLQDLEWLGFVKVEESGVHWLLQWRATE